MSAQSHLLIAVTIADEAIQIVAEGQWMSGHSSRQWANLTKVPFLPAFIWQPEPDRHHDRVTILALFMTDRPYRVWAEASGELVSFLCGDGRQELDIIDGGIPGIGAVSQAAVHWDNPRAGHFYGIVWDQSLELG